MYRCRSCNGARQCSVQSQRVTPSTTRRSPFRFCGRTNHKIPSLSKFLCLVPGVQYSIVQERFSILASAKPALSRLSRISAKISQELGPNSCRRFTTLISTMSIALRPSNPTSVNIGISLPSISILTMVGHDRKVTSNGACFMPYTLQPRPASCFLGATSLTTLRDSGASFLNLFDPFHQVP